ncbi:DIS3-like exonuclease 1 isoform X2 [Liolophura sinensis]|uniref:DIS3-like exonuclease 1 isoform X2 n=1 Tax=Liolophura sinensis TaxID=3198878 RepID=UPI00315991FB
MERRERQLRVRNSQGHSIRVVRELYLREDIPCHSPLCLAGCETPLNQGTHTGLAKEVTHYLIPDAQVTTDYLEILEVTELTGIVFTQSVTDYVQHEGGRRLHNRLKSLIKNGRKGSVLFNNEFQKFSYCERQAGEALQDWLTRSTYQSSVWYYDHLAGKIPIVMVTENREFLEEHENKKINVFVMDMKGYLDTFWSHLSGIDDLFEALTAAKEESVSKAEDEYSGYLPLAVLEAGIKAGRFVQGNLHVNKHNPMQEAFIKRTSAQSASEASHMDSDILIPGMGTRNRAIHGDSVVVELLPRPQWKGKSLAIKENEEGTSPEEEEDMGDVMPTGRVVGILQRNWRDYVVSFSQDEAGQKNPGRAGKVLVIPWDYRIPKIRISTRQVDTLRECRIIVRIDSWPADSAYPNGHLVKSLGTIGDIETEVAALLVENTITVAPFSDGQLKELPVNSEDDPWVMEPIEVSRRKDLRTSHLIFSIDPKGCEDVDDTLSVRKLPNGHLELGVHIADVTYFVPSGSLTDLEAQSRSTTVYLADRRYDMLPGVLSSDLCSLISNVDRFAVSVIWELDQQMEVVGVWYGRTVIRSQYKLFYEIAQAMHDGMSDEELVANIPELQKLHGDTLNKSLAELKEAVNMLMHVSRHLKARRTLGGALELEGAEVQVQMDDTKKIEDLTPKAHLEIHDTIAECMIFANHWVARKIADSYPNQALLRHHPLPREGHFENLIQCAKAKGFEIRTDSNKALAESLDKCVDPEDPMVNKLLRSLATQAMSNAMYFSTGAISRDQFFHYGLALDRYTHFTSPIRRYADVIVHRQLLSAIGQMESHDLLSNNNLSDLCQHINNKHRSAQNAQRDSQELFQALFFRDKHPDDECCKVDAVIFQLRANGFLVFIPRYGIKGPVYLRSKEGQVVYISETEQPEWTSGTVQRSWTSVTVDSVLGSHTYNLFDHVTVKLSLQLSHAHPSSLRLDLVSNERHQSWVDIALETTEKTDIVKEVHTAAEEKPEKVVNFDLGSDFNRLQEMYGQTAEKDSLYSLFQSFREMALV